mgnify:CR=1 FL=1
MQTVFYAKKMANIERTQILKRLSEIYQVKLYTKNPTPELPNVINMGSVDYYDMMPYVFKCSDINLNITLRSIKTGISTARNGYYWVQGIFNVELSGGFFTGILYRVRIWCCMNLMMT